MKRPILAALCAVLAVACSSYGSPDVSAGPNEVIMQGESFSPASRTVASGTTITWVNRDGTGHTTTRAGQEAWDSGVLGANQSFSHTFNTPGAYPYECTVHPGMNGTITVTQ